MSTEETVAVEIPLEKITAHYLRLSGGFMTQWAVKHLNRDGRDFFTVEISPREVGKEMCLGFRLRNGPDEVREVVLSFDQIFNQAHKLDELLTLLRQRENEK